MGGVGRCSQCWEKARSSGEKQGKGVEKEPVWKGRVTAWGRRSGGAERDVLGSMLGKCPLGSLRTRLDEEGPSESSHAPDLKKNCLRGRMGVAGEGGKPQAEAPP
jgi:hypothetical protein